MILTPLGHTQFLIDIVNSEGRNIRILVDSWLSDFAVGDLMERSVKVKLDREKIKTIDAIYISHSHTDHFDPYTLTQIYRTPDSRFHIPILILPHTLQYLIPLIREYLGDIEIEVLFPRKVFSLYGIEIRGHVFPQSTITNEDDVMMLSIENHHELLFAEIDSIPEEDDLDTQKQLLGILSKKSYETILYIASRNELAGDLPLLDLPAKKRRAFRDEYIAGRKEEMYFAYQKWEYEEFANFPNIYEIPHLVRGFIGQGIGYPRELSLDFSQLQIFPLEEIASMESDIARECGYHFPQKALLPGRQYRIEHTTIEPGRKECPIGELIIDRERGNIETDDVRIYASGPLSPRESIDLDQAKSRILEVLNHRFLPYWSASPVVSLRSAMIENSDGCYRIQLISINSSVSIIFEYSFVNSGFTEIAYNESLRIDESYWLDDILDFLDGRQELYSNFWHKMDPAMVYRLWICLGANFCNNDLVINKYRLHFERASRGQTSQDFLEEMKKGFVFG